MSFCKKWRDSGQQVGETCEKARRGTPALLRLDSTGEVAPVSTIQSRNMCQGRRNCVKSVDKQNNVTLKSVVNNLTMSSVIDTASSYLTTASSYIESFCPYKTSTNLVDSRSPYIPDINTDPMFQHNNMFRQVNYRQGKGPNSCDSFSMEEINTPQGYSKTWGREFFGALQSTMFNKDSCMSATMSKSNKYIPPPIKLRLLREGQWHGLQRDSNLTPYNAMLLQRSRQNSMKSHCRSGRYIDSKTAEKQDSVIIDRKSCGTSDRTDKAQLTLNNCVTDKSAPKEKCENSQTSIKDDLINETKAKVKPDENSITTPDWFEYENESEIIIPIDIHKQELKTDPTKCISNVPSVSSFNDEESQERCKSLHSWYSMENNVTENMKQASNDAVQMHCVSSQRLFNEPTNCTEDSKSKTEKLVSSSSKDNTLTEKVFIESNPGSEELNSKGKDKKQQDDHCRKNELFSVLYVRNCNGAKRRSSAQKRSRHRAQKNSATNCDIKSTKTLPNGDAYHPNSSVAFILGLDHDSKERCFSFQIDCDDDFDWSSCDENDQSDDTEEFDDVDFFSPLRNFVNFQVTCSVPTPTSPSFHNSQSVLERINLEWELNMAVKGEDFQKKSQAPKKVHFKKDTQLSTIHHMIAWSYAYQAARKGPWEEIARDRGRFQRRITDGEELLKPILDVKHRKQIFKERFDSA